jgi:Na+/proline symporter
MNNPYLILTIIALYFLALVVIMKLTSKGATNDTFFTGNRKSPWFLVAFGMIGTSLSGVTFLSIPGQVGNEATQFSYMQMVFGYFVGYLVVAYILMPIFYKMNVVSIYTYLKTRFGFYTHKTGAFFFIVSRIIGSAIRLLLVVNILQLFVFDALNVPFEITVIISILLIWLYTNKGGIKTIIWTDTFQTAFMILTVVGISYFIYDYLQLSDAGLIKTVSESGYSKLFFFDDFNSKNYFWKHFLGGAFITIGMTGLDQDMMQKNLSCKNIGEAKKNMMSFASVLILVNLLFLILGVLLYLYSNATGLGQGVTNSDLLFPTIALDENMNIIIGVLFLLGLIAAAYSSADGAMTALTTSVAVDFLDIDKKVLGSQEKMRKTIHFIVAISTIFVIILLKYTTSDAAINSIMFFAGFTYGPLIALFFFGILTKRYLHDRWVPIISLLSIAITVLLWSYSKGGIALEKGEPGIFGDYMFGVELIILNFIITFIGLFSISTRKKIDYSTSGVIKDFKLIDA